jgi:hypothetical protein
MAVKESILDFISKLDDSKDPTIVKLPNVVEAICGSEQKDKTKTALDEIADRARAGRYADFHSNSADMPKMELVCDLRTAAKTTQSEIVKEAIEKIITQVKDGVYDA